MSQMITARNRLAKLEDGCILEFADGYHPDKHDIISFTLDNGENRVVIVEEVIDSSTCIVSHSKRTFTTHLRLLRLDVSSFRVVFDAHHRDMPEAF